MGHSVFHFIRDKMRLISTLVILWSIFNLARSRDGEDQPEFENILEVMEEDDEPSLGRTFGRAAAVDHQKEAAGSQKPPLPFFNKPVAFAPAPVPGDDDFVENLVSLIKRRIWKHVQSQTQHCQSKPLDLSKWRQCQCTSPAKYSPEGFGNCNFGASKTDKRVWCYVNRDFGLDPRRVCPDAVASTSSPGWHWSRVACIT